MSQPLTTESLDRILVGKPEKIWGAPAIAQALGVSVATVYRFAVDRDCPISKKGGRYFAARADLNDWLKRKDNDLQRLPE